jgi:asparaginyl-tRNA synthetase
VDHCGSLAFLRQSGQLTLDTMIARGFPAVWCECESQRREWKLDERHLTGFKLIEAEREGLDLDGLCDLLVRLLRHVTSGLGADLLGGMHVTRLDRILHAAIPRVTYREALAVLNGRGWSMPFGEDLHRDAEATLIRAFDHLPVLVTHWPAALKPFNMKRDPADPEVTLSVELVLPYAGETCDGGVRETDAGVMKERLAASGAYRQLVERADIFARQQAAGDDDADEAKLAARHRAAIDAAFERYLEPFRAKERPRAGFGLGVARMLQYLQGLQSIRDAVVLPQDRNTFAAAGGGADTAAGTALA